MTVQSQVDRQHWMAVLAKAVLPQLEQHYGHLGQQLPTYQFLRSPEIGLVMVRGRSGGTGQRFNLGEMTLTRCVAQLTDQSAITGFGYVAGRSQRHAELAAVCDALLQHPDWTSKVQSEVIEPLEMFAQQRREAESSQVEATRVNFFTMMRGE